MPQIDIPENEIVQAIDQLSPRPDVRPCASYCPLRRTWSEPSSETGEESSACKTRGLDWNAQPRSSVKN